MSTKDVRAIVKYAMERGFVIVRKTRHIVLRRRTRQLTIARTASCQRAYKNAKADIDRIVKKEP